MTNGQTGCGVQCPRAPGAGVREEELNDRQLLERFARHQDGAAFAILVRRHGPMVLGVCRRALGHLQDAEDAFQATFLVLARKARSLGRPELLAGWLYGVAFRTARKARARALRRREHERRAALMPRAEPPDEPDWQEVRASLDEELNQLPEKYRAPLVLCYLEGKTNAEAARQLGWPPGSMSARLARGRELLRERLEGRRRSGALPAGMFLAVLTRHAGDLTLPDRLAGATVRAALALVRGGPGAAMASPAVRDLARAVLRGMGTARLKLAVGALLVAAALIGIGLVGSGLVGGPGLHLSAGGSSGTSGCCH